MDAELAFGGQDVPSEALAIFEYFARAAREIQEGIAVDPLLVGCGLKTHDFDFKTYNSMIACR